MAKKQSVALVYDWLTEIGGAEQVLLELTKLFPEAPIYTSQYRPRSSPWFKDCDVRTGWLNILPRGLRKFISPLRMNYFSQLDLGDYDVVISVCNSESKAVKTDRDTLHIAYLQGPPTQYYWGMYKQYLANPGFGVLNPLARWGLKIFVKPMRKRDLVASKRPDVLVANSNYVRNEIKKYYHRDSVVIFPPVNVDGIRQAAKKVSAKDVRQIKQQFFDGADFYIVAGRQVNWKRFDIAVKACLAADENLLVIGDGPEHKKLVELAGGDQRIKFLPRYNGASEIAAYFRSARGFIFTSLEPFGIVPVEALSAGLPIIAYCQGGAADIVDDGVNGIYFYEQNTNDLVAAIDRFKNISFDKRAVSHSADRYNSQNFRRNFKKIIRDNMP